MAEGYRRNNTMRRVFVDITTSVILAGQQSSGLSRVEAEVAGRLLSSNLNFIPVVFRNDGLLFALSPPQVALIFSFKPAGSQEDRPSKQVSLTPTAKRAAALITDRKATLQPSLPMRLRLLATAKLRYAVAALMARAPNTVRQDARAILMHFRRIVRALTYRHPGSAPSTAVSSILATLQMLVHPRLGDVLWTAGLFSDFVPLRRIGEMRARNGLRVVTTCCGVTHPLPSPSTTGDKLFTADAVALLDASDLVLALCERTRHELLALAAHSGREPPAVQILQVGEGLRKLLDLDDEESPKATIADTRKWPKLAIPGPDASLWDELAATVKKRLQILLAETDGD
jgi:hypothetical protein